MSIITNQVENTLSFEQSLTTISTYLQLGKRSFIIKSELGDILVERLSSMSMKARKRNRIVEVYNWGDEPATNVTICERHNPDLKFYAAIYTPFNTVAKDRFDTVAMWVMGKIFILKMSGRMLCNREFDDNLIDMMMSFSYKLTIDGFRPEIRSMIAMENCRNLRSLSRRLRDTALEYVHRATKFRTDTAIESMNQLLNCGWSTDFPQWNSVLGSYWHYMLFLGMRIQSHYSNCSITDGVTYDTVRRYFNDHPDVDMTECQVVMNILLHGDMFLQPDDEKKDDKKDAEDSDGPRDEKKPTGRRPRRTAGTRGNSKTETED